MIHGENYNTKPCDDGYGDIKYEVNGQPELIPSFVTTFKPKPTDVLQHSGQKLRYIAVEVDGYKYVVGDYAIKLDTNSSWVGGENKHADSRFPILLKTALGLMTTGAVEVIDTLMMNLPIKYDTPERRKNLKELVEGTHEVGISFDGINFMKKSITVEHVDIKKQPFGSICDAMLDDNGEIINKELAKGFNAIVDIGARTLNILTLDALEEQPDLTKQTSDGMYVPYMEIGKYLEDKFSVLIPDGKLPLIIREKQMQGVNLVSLIDTMYENHANTILNVIDKLFVNSWAFVNNIIFTGGGSELLKPYLKDRMAKRTNVIFLDRFSNARGLRKYGVRQSKRNIKRQNTSISGITGTIGSSVID